MYTNFQSIDVLYVLSVLFGIVIFVSLRLRQHRVKKLPEIREVIDTEITLHPIVTDLLADLFMGELSGYLISLINGSDRELLYYRQLLDLIYVRFVKVSKSDILSSTTTRESFVSGIQEEINKQTTTKLKNALHDRLNDLVGYISESHYYQHTSLFEVKDIYTAMTRAVVLIEKYSLVSRISPVRTVIK